MTGEMGGHFGYQFAVEQGPHQALIDDLVAVNEFAADNRIQVNDITINKTVLLVQVLKSG